MGEHLRHLDQVFGGTQKENFRIYVTNSSFFHLETKLVGHLVYPTGMMVDMGKIMDIV